MNRAKFFFKFSAIVLLAITALFKLVTIAHPILLLDQPDPVLMFLPRWWVLLLASILEIGVAYAIGLCRRDTETFAILCLLCVSFWIYRLILFCLNYQEPCFCLGRLGDWINVKQPMIDLGTGLLLVYLTFGGFIFLILSRIKIRRLVCTR